MAEPSSGIGNVTSNTALVEMAMGYSRSRVLSAAARLGVADALGDEVRSVGFLAEKCEADADALYRLLRALEHRRHGRDGAGTLSADLIWQTSQERCA